ncbi:Dol-P-Glc:Glc(2)Man(9)GlcNAc(2)-PP-Dol alpha-1,2-glucosyltransferase [Smittium mucronatum]|uniref:Dol-P-Glc:Glc(2)Man(9)GlcNAc(2)-PP-Dol alpha-1,2-glucosyltransferase n=1 Tax=Smittium mucronatum TaxID=133383 RepID=A0A1R0H5J4_9FUNG|nr:Dol-P-Glc:Glc(2)Man(9)GlcNAc(2)-PP-Dol alpha-1,2-glucosyltransferase [Smittium mucronatum]
MIRIQPDRKALDLNRVSQHMIDRTANIVAESEIESRISIFPFDNQSAITGPLIFILYTMDNTSKLAFAIYSIVGLAILIRTNKLVPLPYMDEIFHVGQVQAYCRGDYFSYDPKLTTPPGLYIVSLVFVKVSQFLGLTDTNGCSVKALRTYNYILSLALFFVLHSLISTLNKNKSHAWKALTTITLMFFPVSFFFNQLYYTEVASLLSVLLGYKFALDKKYWLSSFIFLISLSMRQTNVIYAAMVMGYSVLQELNTLSSPTNQAIINQPAYSTRTLDSFLTQFKVVLIATLSNLPNLLITLSGYLVVFSSFAYFLYSNGGIVLGDKSNHVATLHFPQMYYLIMFLAGMCFPAISHIVDPIYFFRKNFLRIEHPFILSDNRHFSFYIWKDVYRRHYLIRYILVPVYFYAGWLCWRSLAITLIPSPLLEFRYFIMPYYFYRLHIEQPGKSRTLTELVWNLVINLGVYYLFFNKPFIWPQNPNEIMRFMW